MLHSFAAAWFVVALAAAACAGPREKVKPGQLDRAIAQAERRALGSSAEDAATMPEQAESPTLDDICTRLTWQCTTRLIDRPLLRFGLAMQGPSASDKVGRAAVPANASAAGFRSGISEAAFFTLDAAAVSHTHGRATNELPDEEGTSRFVLAIAPGDSHGHPNRLPPFKPTGWGIFAGQENHPPFFTNILYDRMLCLTIGPNLSGGNTTQVAGGSMVIYGDPASESVGIGWRRRSR